MTGNNLFCVPVILIHIIPEMQPNLIHCGSTFIFKAVFTILTSLTGKWNKYYD